MSPGSLPSMTRQSSLRAQLRDKGTGSGRYEEDTRMTSLSTSEAALGSSPERKYPKIAEYDYNMASMLLYIE